MTTWRQAAIAVVAMLVVTNPANAVIDLTGDWNVHVSIDGVSSHVQPIQVVQTGTVMEWYFGIPTPSYTGTIDVDTGVFTMSGGSGCITSTYNGVGAADSRTFTASGTEYGPPPQCAHAVIDLIGARVPCGDGVLDPGESCDDGNNFPGDCCSPICEPEPAGSPCSDGNSSTCELCDGAGMCASVTCPTPTDTSTPTVTNTPADTPTPTPTGSACAATPLTGCDGPEPFKGLFVMKNNTDDDRRDKIKWKYDSSAGPRNLGDPITTTTYTVCVYAGGAVEAIELPAGSRWETLGTTGFRFKDPTGTPDGAQKAKLKPAVGNRPRVLLIAKGTNVPDTLAPPLPLPVVVQMVNSSDNLCYSAFFDASGMIQNDVKQFKGKTSDPNPLP